MFLALLVIDAIVGIYPQPIYLLLIPVVLVEVVLTLGVMLIVSQLSVLIRTFRN
jgi:ABC-type polysaccharide/polyol phosphate export permease